MEKLEKRLHEALMRMLNGSESFYFTYSGDLTNSTQRRILEKFMKDVPLWQQVLISILCETQICTHVCFRI